MAEPRAETPKPQPRSAVQATNPAKVPAPKPRSAVPSFDLSPDGIRDLLIAHPELIEEGLTAHTKGGGAASGARFETSVGKIDLLARDQSSGWVVVMVAEPAQGKELVGDMLQLMGWVRKHLSSEGQEVRGIVLVDSVPEDLGYAAAAVAGTVEFTRYRVGLTLEKVDV
ncbi:MAG TPA: endonuclease NucS domain-containing protein [Myxococcota bacterium]